MGHHAKKRPKEPKPSTKEKLKLIKKERKLKLKEKRAKLIIRNLAFHATEEDLKEHFGKYGEIADIKILKTEEGKLVGCGFVQFKLVQKAAKAKHYTNGKPLLGRDISVDFAMAKDRFKETVEAPQIKQEDEVKIKEEPVDIEEMEQPAEEIEEHKEDAEVQQSEEESASDEEEKSNEESNTETEEEEEEEEDEKCTEIEAKKPKFESNDVTEGKTIFIKNVPFTATNEDLKECMKQFGSVYYALICVDKYTEHSKGTAFVKFRDKEAADEALTAGTELTLLGNVLDCHRALGRQEVAQKAVDKKESKAAPKDSRNLYLVKEGVILAGSKSAEGVSATDMAKRLQLEQYKTQMLRKLNMFVARDRLVVHNLPPSWDDKKLRLLVKNNSPKTAIIREARVMRDMKNVDADGVGRSKEFGFVAFNRHEDALSCLRSLNNNPNIFSANRRPIVAFSIENRSMIRAKQKRMEKSRLKNPHCKAYDPNVVKMDKEKRESRNNEQESERKPFVGVAARPGVQKMRSRHNLRTQAQLHYENVKKEKKKQKFAKKTFKEKQQDFTKQPKQKINKKPKNDDNFARLVSDYKKKLTEASQGKKTKWYQEN